MYWLVSTTIINIVINYTVRVIDGNWYVGKVGRRFSKIVADIDIAKQLCKRERYIYDFFYDVYSKASQLWTRRVFADIRIHYKDSGNRNQDYKLTVANACASVNASCTIIYISYIAN